MPPNDMPTHSPHGTVVVPLNLSLVIGQDVVRDGTLPIPSPDTCESLADTSDRRSLRCPLRLHNPNLENIE